MRRARFGLREAFGGAPDGGLPEDGEVAFAIGLKGDAVVRGPDRKAVVPAEREPPHPARAGQVIGVDDRFFAVIGPESDTRAVWSHPRRQVRTGREPQRFNSSRRSVRAISTWPGDAEVEPGT